MALTKIKHVYGNVLRVAIPLTQRVRTLVEGVETEVESDFYPSPNYPVLVDLYKGGGLHQTFTATMNGHVATFVDEGTIPIGVYQVEVRCHDMDGHPCRYMVRAIIIIVDATIDAGIEAGIEFNSETYTLEGTVYYYAKGDTGVGIESITQISESQENGGINVIRVTLTDGTYSDFNVRNGKLTAQQEERLAKVEADYVIWTFERDGSTFNTFGHKYSEIGAIRNSGRVLHIRLKDNNGEERLFVDQNETSQHYTAYFCEGQRDVDNANIIGAKVYNLTRGDNDSINVTEINYESLLRPYLNSILYKGIEIANQAFVRDQNILVHFDIDDTITCDESVLNIIAALNANKRVLGEANLVNRTLFSPSYFADNVVVFDFISPIDGHRSTLFGSNNNNVDTWQLTEGQVYLKPSSGIPKSDLDSNVQASLSKADDTYTRAQVDALINTAKQLTFVVVASLPAPSSSTVGKIYLVPSESQATRNIRDEYITISVAGVYRWELIGSTSADLSNYLTKDAFKDKTKVLKIVSVNPLQWESGHDALAKEMFNEICNFNRSSFDTDNIVPIFNLSNGYVYNLTHTRPRLNESNVRIGAKNVFYSINTTSTSRLIIDTDLSGNIVSISEAEDNSVDQKINDAINNKTTHFSLQKHSDGSISFYDESDLEVEFTYALSEISWRRAIVYTNENLDPMGEGEQDSNQTLLFVYQKNERYDDSTYHTFVNFSQPSTFYRLILLEGFDEHNVRTLTFDDLEEVSFVQLMSNGKIDPYLLDDSTKASLALANSALQSETDPTVPSWAKQPTKPSYTAQEVGALPNTTTIPTSLSQLTDDATHRTVSDTEKSTWNNKSNFSGSYNDLTDKPTIPAAVQSNWNETDATSAAYIQNKPEVYTKTQTDSAIRNVMVGNTIDSGTVVKIEQDGSSKRLVLRDDRNNVISGIVPSTDTSSAWDQELDTVIPTLKLVKDKISAIDVTSQVSGKADKSEMSVSTSGDKTTITLKTGTSAEVINQHQDISGKQDVISDLEAIRSGAAAGATAVQPATMNTALAGKQNTLTFDSTPTASSSNPVTSGGVKSALDAKADKSDTYTKAEVNNLIVPASTTIQVVASLPATGTANTIYRVPGSGNYTDYGWDGVQFIPLAVSDGLSVNQVVNANIAPDAVTPYSCGFFERSSNLYNKDDADCADGKYVNASNGNLSSGSNLKASGWIRVTPATYYISNYGGQSAWYDKNKQYISGNSVSSTAMLAPANAAYLRVSYKISDDGINRLNEGQTLLAYEDFYENIPLKHLNLDGLVVSEDEMSIFRESDNLFDLGKARVGVHANIINGKVVYSGSSNLLASAIMPVVEGASYYGYRTHSYVSLDSNYFPVAYNTWVSGSETIAQSNPIIIQTGVNYIIVNFYVDKASIARFSMGCLIPFTEPGKVLDLPIYSMPLGRQLSGRLGNSGAWATADSLADTESISISDFPVSLNKGNQIAFEAKITSFSSVVISKGGGSDYRALRLTIDGDSAILDTQTGSNTWANVATAAHGLTISTYIRVLFAQNYDNTFVSIETLGASYTGTLGTGQVWNGEPSARSVGSTLTDCKLTIANKYIKSPLWAFGDSYYGWNTQDRELYWIRQWGYDNFLTQAYPGQLSYRANLDFARLLSYGCPKFVIWALGMNDSVSTLESSEWYRQYLIVKAACEERGITLILQTIPKPMDSSYTGKNIINDFIRSSGERYIDAASAVGANSLGQWYGYGTEYDYQSTDNVHPSEYGARAIAMQYCIDAPEIMQY